MSVEPIRMLSEETIKELDALPNNRRAELAQLWPQVDEALRLYGKTKSISSIARHFGLLPNTVQDRARKLGI